MVRGKNAQSPSSIPGGELAADSVLLPLERLHFRVPPEEWLAAVESFRISAFGKFSWATQGFVLGCIFHVSALDICQHSGTAENINRDVAAAGIAEIQARIDTVLAGKGTRSMASKLIAAAERTLRQGGVIHHHTDELLYVLATAKIEDILQAEDSTSAHWKPMAPAMADRATIVHSQSQWDANLWENVSAALKLRGYLPGELGGIDMRMNTGIDYKAIGITLTENVHFGIQKLADANERPRRFFREVILCYSGNEVLLLRTIRLVAHSLPVSAMFMKVHDDWGFAKENGVYSGTFPSTSQNHLTFKPGESYTFTIELQNNFAEPGLLHHDLVFIFSPVSTSGAQPFIVCHSEIFALLVKKSDFDTIKLDFNAPPFYPSSIRNTFMQAPDEYYTDFTTFQTRQGPHEFRYQPQIVMQEDFENAMYPDMFRTELRNLEPEWLPGVFSRLEIWSKRFSCRGGSILRGELRLLMMEYHALLSQIPAYDLFNQEIDLQGQTQAKIRVPGVSDGRPQLVLGGRVLLRSRLGSSVEIVCRIVAVYGVTVILQLPNSTPTITDAVIRTIQGNSFCMHCRFIPDCVKLARSLNSLLRALVRVNANTRGCCFQFSIVPCHEHWSKKAALVSPPKKSLKNKVQKDRDIQWVNIRLNSEQRAAVHTYCSPMDATEMLRESPQKPVIVFGPPGTGKSNTVVECVLQIIKTQQDSRICLSAPNEFVVDLLVSALANHGIDRNEMHRLCDPRRTINSVKEDIRPFCYVNPETNTHDIPPEGLEKFKIIAVCCGTCSLLDTWVSSQKCDFHFTHVLIDEAGQATFAESLSAIIFPYSHNNQSRLPRLLLAGDPLQLGPILKSKTAQRMLLGKSLLELLNSEHHFSFDIEKFMSEGDFSTSIMLRRNYRSHPQLLQLPSSLFYSDRLLASADDSLIALPTQWPELQGSQFPILYYSVSGQQIKSGEADSYFNTHEALKVVFLVENLIKSAAAPIDDLGVMATYRSQVVKIRELLREKGLRDVRVGTVEDYQGQEARIIFVSTVISDVKALRSARNSEVPALLLGNASLFNVAITRAHALLVVVGHPKVLSEDLYWRELLTICRARGTWRGSDSIGMGNRSVGQCEDENDMSEEAKAMDMLGAKANLGYGSRYHMFDELGDQGFSDDMARIDIN